MRAVWSEAARSASVSKSTKIMVVLIARGIGEDVGPAAEVVLRSRKASVPEIPPPVHSDDEVRAWFQGVVFEERELWVAKELGAVDAVMVLDGDWIDQLYVDPDAVGGGLGTRMVAVAKEQRPGGLKLWTFAANVRAQRFYERQGFVMTASTASDNEERAPALRYEWNLDASLNASDQFDVPPS